MKTYLNIGLARNDGEPDNSAVRVLVELNKHGFILEDAYLQGHLSFSGRPPESVLLAQVTPPQHFMRLLPRLAAKLACNIVLCRTSEPSPSSRSWLATPDGIQPFKHND